MTDTELIARLRENQAYEWQDPIWETRIVAADRIEALTKQLAAARQDAKAAEDELELQEQEACMMENDYLKLEKERDALEANLAQAVERLEAWVKLSEHCSIEDGVCCCGEDMEGHSNPMNCGHSPVDHGAYIAGQLEESTRATLAEIKAT